MYYLLATFLGYLIIYSLSMTELIVSKFTETNLLNLEVSETHLNFILSVLSFVLFFFITFKKIWIAVII